MPLPKSVAKLNRRLTNPVARRFAGRVPPLAIVEHTGRRSGATYRTPVMAFPAGGGFAIVLTYGPDVDWVKNVLAERRAILEYGGKRLALGNPRLTRGIETIRLPWLARTVLPVVGVDLALHLGRVSPESPTDTDDPI